MEYDKFLVAKAKNLLPKLRGYIKVVGHEDLEHLLNESADTIADLLIRNVPIERVLSQGKVEESSVKWNQPEKMELVKGKERLFF